MFTSTYLRIPISIILLLLINRSSAQSSYYVEDQPVFRGGVIAGCNFSTIDNFSRDFQQNFSNYVKIGADIGGVVYVRLGKHLQASMEISYSQTGRKTNGLVETGISGVNFTHIYDQLNYVAVPIMLNYFDKAQNHIGVGFSYGRLVSSTETLTTEPAMNIQTSNYPFNSADYEVVAGGALHLWKQLFFILRFQYSIVQIRTTVPTNFTPTEQNNNFFMLGLMWLWK